MTPDAFAAAKQRILKLIEATEVVAFRQFDMARELLSVNEAKVCLEFLCDPISEEELAIPIEVADGIACECVDFGLQFAYYSNLARIAGHESPQARENG